MEDHNEMNFDYHFRSPNEGEQMIDWPLFTKEVALHEASHYIIGRLIINSKLGFREVNEINFDFSSTPITANVGVTRPNVPEYVLTYKSVPKYANMIKDFYLENPYRIFAEIFSHLAGHASYKIFFYDVENFISYTNFLNYKNSIWYYDLNRACNCDIADFVKTREKLDYLNCSDFNTQVKKIKLCIDYLQIILNQRSIKCSIGYVKNQILNNKSRQFSEPMLSEIRSSVNEYTKNFDFTYWIMKYAAHF